jgi:hypothetical protein
MAPSTEPKAKGKQPAKVPRLKLNLKAPAKAAPKGSDEVFLLTLLKDIKVSHLLLNTCIYRLGCRLY